MSEGLTRPIPPDAMPVVEVLRRDVERPVGPMVESEDGSLRWKCDGDFNRGDPKVVKKCPMGLHPGARNPVPIAMRHFPLASHPSITAFAEWWDEQRDAVAAVNAVWSTEDDSDE